MRFLDNLRIIFGLVAMILAVGWYGSKYVGIDLPEVTRGLISAAGAGVSSEESIAPPSGPLAMIAPYAIHAIPAALVLLGIVWLLPRNRRAESGEH